MTILVHRCLILTCMVATREPRPGERCACGKPAVIVYVKQLGDVPSCQKPKLETEAPPPWRSK